MMTVILIGERASIKSRRLDRGMRHYIDMFVGRSNRTPFNYSFIDYKKDGSGKVDPQSISKDKIPLFYLQDENRRIAIQAQSEDDFIKLFNSHLNGEIDIFEYGKGKEG